MAEPLNDNTNVLLCISACCTVVLWFVGRLWAKISGNNHPGIDRCICIMSEEDLASSISRHRDGCITQQSHDCVAEQLSMLCCSAVVCWAPLGRIKPPTLRTLQNQLFQDGTAGAFSRRSVQCCKCKNRTPPIG